MASATARWYSSRTDAISVTEGTSVILPNPAVIYDARQLRRPTVRRITIARLGDILSVTQQSELSTT